jgi:hypothetical protein
MYLLDSDWPYANEGHLVSGTAVQKKMSRPGRPRQTRSTSSKKLHVNRTKSTYGDRSFSVGAARLWNELPQHFMPLEDKESFKR